uniref:Uncharacterized protein n=1 Tax=Brassica campestris TaxID=3711 RepID=A0A3P5ZNA0_BRACM|nr:unnamed protein product [Brassica rapa]
MFLILSGSVVTLMKSILSRPRTGFVLYALKGWD